MHRHAQFTISLQNMDLRSLLGGGLGWLRSSDATTLDWLASINYTHERYSGMVTPT